MSANKTTQGGQYFMIRSKNTKLVSKTPNYKTTQSPMKTTPMKQSNAKESIFDENSKILKRIHLFHKSPKIQENGVIKLIQILTHLGLNQKELFLKNLVEHCCLLIMEQKINEYNKQKLLGKAFKGLKQSQSENKAKPNLNKFNRKKSIEQNSYASTTSFPSINKSRRLNLKNEYFVIAKHQRINTERSKIKNILNMKTKAPEHTMGTNSSSRERINSRKSENSVSSLQLDKPRKSTGKFKQDEPWNLSNSQIQNTRKSTGKLQKDEPQIQSSQTTQKLRKSTASNQSVSSSQIQNTRKSTGKFQKEEFQSPKKHRTKNSNDLDSQFHSSIAPQPFFKEPQPINMPWQSDLDEISFRGSDNSLQFTLARNHQNRNLKQKLMNSLKMFYTDALVKEDAVMIARVDIQKRQVFFHWYSQIQNLREQNQGLKNGLFNLKNVLEFIIKKQVLNMIYEVPQKINQTLPNSTIKETKQNRLPQNEEQLNTIEESKLIEVKEEQRKFNIKDEKNDEKKKMYQKEVNQKEMNQKEELRNSNFKSDAKKTIKEDKKPREEKKLKEDKKIEKLNQEPKMHKEDFKVPMKRYPQQKKIEEEPKKKFVQAHDQNQFVWSKINKWLLDPNQKSTLEGK